MYRGPSLYRHCLLPKILPLNRICCYKELDMDPSKALIMDTFEHFFYKSYTFGVHVFVRGDSNKYTKRMFS